MTDSKSLTTEDLLNKIGCGLYQVLLMIFSMYIMLCWNSLIGAIVILLISEPRWECVNNSTVCNITGSVGPGEQNYDYRCGISRQDWTFVDEYTSLVTQFDLVCDKSSIPQYIYTTNTVGYIVGAFICGILSDKFGRKRTLFASGFLICSLLLLVSFSQNYWMAAILLFFVGVGFSGVMYIGFIFVVEYAVIKYRSLMGNGLWLSNGCGFMLIAGVGYFVREWSTLTLIVSLCGVPAFAAYCFVPESLRWLLVEKRADQAMKILKTAAKVNGKVLEDDIQLPTYEDDTIADTGDLRLLFSSGYAVTTLVVWYSSFVNALVYNGVNLSAPNVGGSTYFNWFLSGISEFVSTSCSIYVHNRFGRKKCIIICQIMAALSAFGSVVLTLYDNGSTGFFVGKILMSMVLAKFFIVISYNGIILITSELYPTVIRNVAEGTSGAFGSIGYVISVYVTYLIRVHPLLPYGIMGINALISGLLCLVLKETKDQPMQEVLPHSREDEKLDPGSVNYGSSDPNNRLKTFFYNDSYEVINNEHNLDEL